MRPIALLLLTVLATAANADELQPAPVIGRFKGSGTGAGLLLAGKVVIKPAETEGALDLVVRGQVKSGAPRTAQADGAWEFELVPGTLAGLADHLAGEASSTPVVLRLELDGEHVKGEITRGEARLGTVRLRRQARALVLPQFDGDDDKDTTVFRVYGRQVARYYRGRGYEVDTWDGIDDYPELTTKLLEAEAAGTLYSRVVLIGHGGWDGPMIGDGWQQVSARMKPKLWSAFTHAFARATTPGASAYNGSCHGGGSNKYERAGKGFSPYVWGVDLARSADRIVTGPAGSTSTAWSLRQVKAVLEGQGTTRQETIWANSEGYRIVWPGRRLSGARLRDHVPEHVVADEEGEVASAGLQTVPH